LGSSTSGTDGTERRPDAEDRSRQPSVGETIDRRTGRWRGASALALLAGAVGIFTASPPVVLAGVVGVAVAAAARAARPPKIDLELDRTLAATDPEPGAAVGVEVTVRNAGDALLPDVRVVDGVPPGLAVAAGSPRLGTALRPGGEARFSYAVTAARGAHRFEPALALARDATGAAERAIRVATVDETRLTCVPALGAGVSLAPRARTTGQVGRIPTAVGGPGVEFHATREYRPGDPLSRVDWRRLAAGGDLSTVDFREERAAAVVLLIDAREAAYRAPGENAESAVERAIGAAGRVAVGLLEAGDRVGVAALAPESCWLTPGTGTAHRARLRELLGTHPALSPTPPEEPFFPSIRLRRLRRRLPEEAQVVLCSPLCDDYAASVARRLDAHGHSVTTLAPDPTVEDTPGRQLARIERDNRLSELRRAGIPAIDWAADESLAAALARAGRER
jgi:uncharacterized protein (DUF58 family)